MEKLDRIREKYTIKKSQHCPQNHAEVIGKSEKISKNRKKCGNNYVSSIK